MTRAANRMSLCVEYWRPFGKMPFRSALADVSTGDGAMRPGKETRATHKRSRENDATQRLRRAMHCAVRKW